MADVVTYPPAITSFLKAANNLNIFVTSPNAAAGSNTNTIVTVGQWQRALSLRSSNGTVYRSLSADYDNLAWIQYSAGVVVTEGDVLYQATKDILGYTSAQMDALMLSASQQPL